MMMDEAEESLERRSLMKALDGIPVDKRATLGTQGVVAYTDGACIKNPGGPAGWSVMLFGAEDRGTAVVALVASHPFEDGEPVVQAVSQDVNRGLIVRHHRSVHPDFIGAQIVRRHGPNKISRWRVVSRWVLANRTSSAEARAGTPVPQES